MAKRKTGWTEQKIKRYIKEGRGQGIGKDYIPWILTYDFPSIGRDSRYIGWKSGRIHHLFSDLETYFCNFLDYSDAVVDIREQFPLDREMTIKIAEEKGIKHPIDSDNQTFITLTSDFLITVIENGSEKHLVRSIKPSNELDKKRVVEKLEIERAYWEQKGIDWV